MVQKEIDSVKHTADVVIVGGGVIGLTIARALARSGAGDICLIERNGLGHEASFAAAGMLAPQLATMLVVMLILGGFVLLWADRLSERAIFTTLTMTAALGVNVARTRLVLMVVTALGLALLRALAVTRHESACLFVRGVLPAPAAVLLELDAIGRVPLRLVRLVVAPLALGAGERDRDSYSGCHLDRVLSVSVGRAY